MNDYSLQSKCVSKCDTMANGKDNSTITGKAEIIQKDIHEIVGLANEISSKIFGSATPKITNDCNDFGVPMVNSIEQTLNDIRGNTTDIRNMLADILKDL